MKYALTTTLAFAFAAGLAGAAAAQTGTTTPNTQPNTQTQAVTPSVNNQAQNQQMQNGLNAQTQNAQMQSAQTQNLMQGSKKDRVREVQQMLQTDGLYKGHVDGILGPKTKAAIGRFQAQNGLRKTDRLNPQTLAKLSQGQNGQSQNETGYGSSIPPANMNGTAPQTLAPNAGESNGPTAPHHTNH